MTKKETITFKETDDDLQRTINIKEVLPYIHSIQQFKPKFKPKDILNERSLESMLMENVIESYKEYLYILIDELEEKTEYKYNRMWNQ